MKLFYKTLIFLVLNLQTVAWSQTTTIQQLRATQEEQLRQAQLNIEEMRRLEDEKVRLANRLAETNQLMTTLQSQTTVNLTAAISLEEIGHILENKTFGGCEVTAGEQLGVYYIKNKRSDERIRFVFLSKENVLAAQAKIVKNEFAQTSEEQAKDVFEIFQPKYDPNKISQEGPVTATIRFELSSNEIGVVKHAVFTGLVATEEASGFFAWFRSKPAEGSMAVITCL